MTQAVTVLRSVRHLIVPSGMMVRTWQAYLESAEENQFHIIAEADGHGLSQEATAAGHSS